jgi:hypothetical protein
MRYLMDILVDIAQVPTDVPRVACYGLGASDATLLLMVYTHIQHHNFLHGSLGWTDAVQ